MKHGFEEAHERISKRTQSDMDRRFQDFRFEIGRQVGGHRPPLQLETRNPKPGTTKNGLDKRESDWIRPLNFLRNEAMRSERQFKVSGSRFKVWNSTKRTQSGRRSTDRHDRDFRECENYETNPTLYGLQISDPRFGDGKARALRLSDSAVFYTLQGETGTKYGPNPTESDL